MRTSLIQNRAKTCLLIAIALSGLVTLVSDRINPYWLYIFYDIGISIIMAVSLNLINGHTGQFSLGHAGFMAVGGYTAAVITNHFGQLNFLAANSVFLFALLAGGLAAAVAGLLVGIPTLRLRGDYLAIVTLGFGEIIRVIFQNMNAVGGARGLSVMHGWTNFFWTFSLAAVTVYVVGSLVNSTYGRGFIAVRDDEIAAEAMGINTTKYKVSAFVVGAFFAGIAGGLYAHAKQFLTPNGFGFMQSITFVVMVILGGMGNTIGVVCAAILLTLLPEGLRMLAGVEHLPGIPREFPLSWIGDTRLIIYSLLLIVLMLTRPQGLFSLRKRNS
jgi:branched-chain amino acid transport system permease protein